MSRGRAVTPLTREQVVTASTIVALVTIIAFEAMAVSTVMPVAGAALGAGGSYGLAFSSMFTAELFGIVVAGTWIAARGAFGVIAVQHRRRTSQAVKCGAGTARRLTHLPSAARYGPIEYPVVALPVFAPQDRHGLGESSDR